MTSEAHFMRSVGAVIGSALGRSKRGRDAKDYAIEFGSYLADAAGAYMRVSDDPYADHDIKMDAWRKLASAIYEFRKRAKRAKQ